MQSTGEMPRTRGCAPATFIEDNCVDGPAARMCLERLCESATSATEVTGHGGRRKMGGRARTGLWWTLVNGDLAASGGSRTSTTEAAIFTFHWAVVTAA